MEFVTPKMFPNEPAEVKILRNATFRKQMSKIALAFTYLPVSPYLYGCQAPSSSGIPAAATTQNATRYWNNQIILKLCKKKLENYFG